MGVTTPAWSHRFLLYVHSSALIGGILFVVHMFVDSRQVILRAFKIQWTICDQRDTANMAKTILSPKKNGGGGYCINPADPINSRQRSSKQIVITFIYPGKDWHTLRMCVLLFLLILSAHCSVWLLIEDVLFH